jgi:UPF0755 protein
VLRLLKWFLGLVFTAALLLAVAALWWLNRPLPMAPQLATQDVVDVSIPPGSSARRVAQLVVRAGFDTQPALLFLWFRASGEGTRIKAGAYEFGPGTTPIALLDKMVRGEQAVRRVTLVEGWTYWQVLQALRQAEHLKYDLPDDSPQALMQYLGLAATHPEGRFFPDTYVYPKYAQASSVLKQAATAMDQRLAQAWAQRNPGVPLKSPEEVLIMASIIEKETGKESDRTLVAGVFANRMRIGMRLQTDPTVIYGQGPEFSGRLRRVHLDTDNPYNTYTRAGLPPTPIAMPGMASIMAAVQPANTDAFYFVARGDGSSQFSRTLDEHNAAVRKYILGR